VGDSYIADDYYTELYYPLLYVNERIIQFSQKRIAYGMYSSGKLINNEIEIESSTGFVFDMVYYNGLYIMCNQNIQGSIVQQPGCQIYISSTELSTESDANGHGLVWQSTNSAQIECYYGESDRNWYYNVTYGNGIYVASSMYGIVYSTNAIEWIASDIWYGSGIDSNTGGAEYICNRVEYLNGLFIALCTVGIRYSTDGINWKYSNIYAWDDYNYQGEYNTGVNTYIDKPWVIYDETYKLYCTRTKIDGTVVSSDGMKWTSIDSDIQAGYRYWGKFANRYITSTSNIMYYSINLTTWYSIDFSQYGTLYTIGGSDTELFICTSTGTYYLDLGGGGISS
jgi:hypothetical protein